MSGEIRRGTAGPGTRREVLSAIGVVLVGAVLLSMMAMFARISGSYGDNKWWSADTAVVRVSGIRPLDDPLTQCPEQGISVGTPYGEAEIITCAPLLHVGSKVRVAYLREHIAPHHLVASAKLAEEVRYPPNPLGTGLLTFVGTTLVGLAFLWHTNRVMKHHTYAHYIATRGAR